MSKLKNLSSNRAITLIALIVTIIVMLILVAVSVSVLVESDLIGAAEKAGNAYKTAYEQEQSLGQITIGNKTYASLNDYFNNNPITGGEGPEDPDPEVPEEVEGIEITLSLLAEEAEVTAGGNVASVTSEGVPVPTGFYYVGGTLNTGVVISDDPDDENKGDGHNVALEGNQFVWVPVLVDQRIKIEVKSENNITGIKVGGPSTTEIATDTQGNSLAPTGTSKTYEAEIYPTINGLYVVQVEAGETSEYAVINVSSLYKQDFFATQGFLTALAQLDQMAAANNKTVDEIIASEAVQQQYPGLTSVVDGPKYIYNAYSHSDFTDTTGNEDMESFAESVETYGGFYIARYEAGSETARISSSAPLTTVYSKKNLYPYNYISQENAIDKVEAMYSSEGNPSITSVTTTLPNGAAGDRTLNWLIETNAVEEAEVTTDSTSWGNYTNSSFTFTGKYTTNYSWTETEASNMTKQTYESSNKYYLLGTGVSNYTRRNNIYDLAGNCREWTTEVLSSVGSVVSRGGNYYGGGDGNPASYRSNDSATYSDNSGDSFRPVLYINQ